MDFGETMHDLLDRTDTSQKQLAIDLDMPPSTIGNYVQGVNEPDFDTLKRIADYFSVSTDYLLDYHPSTKSEEQDQALMEVFHRMTYREKSYLIAQAKLYLNYFSKERKSGGDGKTRPKPNT